MGVSLGVSLFFLCHQRRCHPFAKFAKIVVYGTTYCLGGKAKISAFFWGEQIMVLCIWNKWYWSVKKCIRAQDYPSIPLIPIPALRSLIKKRQWCITCAYLLDVTLMDEERPIFCFSSYSLPLDQNLGLFGSVNCSDPPSRSEWRSQSH